MARAYEGEAQLVRALAHPVRLRILEILSRGEACVCHLTAILRKRQPYVSQQLMLLREASLVTDRKEGTIVYYRLADPRIAEIIGLARGVLQAQGVEVTLPTIPQAPVKGCVCPRCNGGSGCLG